MRCTAVLVGPVLCSSFEFPSCQNLYCTFGWLTNIIKYTSIQSRSRMHWSLLIVIPFVRYESTLHFQDLALFENNKLIKNNCYQQQQAEICQWWKKKKKKILCLPVLKILSCYTSKNDTVAGPSYSTFNFIPVRTATKTHWYQSLASVLLSITPAAWRLTLLIHCHIQHT